MTTRLTLSHIIFAADESNQSNEYCHCDDFYHCCQNSLSAVPFTSSHSILCPLESSHSTQDHTLSVPSAGWVKVLKSSPDVSASLPLLPVQPASSSIDATTMIAIVFRSINDTILALVADLLVRGRSDTQARGSRVHRLSDSRLPYAPRRCAYTPPTTGNAVDTSCRPSAQGCPAPCRSRGAALPLCTSLARCRSAIPQGPYDSFYELRSSSNC